uniref:F-box domain-containing protein n=1 Tax=Oryza punctata TaxID=4537 RepID=A0A0E0KJM3_ORYPU
MSTKRRRACVCPNEVTTSAGDLHACHETGAATGRSSSPLLPELPLDVLLEIAERCDAATVISLAATCKALRHAILGDDFRRRLALRAAANGGFDPALLLGVSYRFHEHGGADAGRLVQVQPSGRRARFYESLLGSFTPVASRDGILVLREHRDASSGGGQLYAIKTRPLELLVCNTLTRHTSSPPSLSFCDDDSTYPPALLTVVAPAPAPAIPSSYWSPTVTCQRRLDSCSAAVTGRTVHWICHKYRSNAGEHAFVILSVHADTARGTVTELPHDCIGGETGAFDVHGLYLAGSAADGRLTLMAAGMKTISVWTLSSSPEEEEEEADDPSRRWSQQVVAIHVQRGIGRSLFGESWKPIRLDESGKLRSTTRFMGFAERSGVGILWMEGGGGLVRFSLATRELAVLRAPACLRRARAIAKQILRGPDGGPTNGPCYWARVLGP